MFIASAVGPTLEELRPLKEAETGLLSNERFPVHPDLLERLLAHDPSRDGLADPAVAHALSVISAYAYAEVVALGGTPDTLARMVSRLGLPGNRVLMVAERIDAAFVVSSGFLVQSHDGRVVVLAYRGTEPFNVASWMTDADLHNAPVTVIVGGEAFPVHPGFYRNVRSIRSPLIEGLDRARRGLSVIDGTPVERPMEALHLTGHSLGAAMATLQAVLLQNDPSYARLAATLRSVHGFGQPMVGGRALATAMSASGQAVRYQRFIYRRDVVPALPPLGLGDYAHFGSQYEVDRAGGYKKVERPVRQAPFAAIPIAAAQFVSHRLPVLRNLPFLYSIDDHLPLNYVDWLAPEGWGSEYGGYPVLAPG
jgi:hypothetical protein